MGMGIQQEGTSSHVLLIIMLLQVEIERGMQVLMGKVPLVERTFMILILQEEISLKEIGRGKEKVGIQKEMEIGIEMSRIGDQEVQLLQREEMEIGEVEVDLRKEIGLGKGKEVVIV